MERDAWVKRYGTRAVVTGAASGIGASFASHCAAAGLDLVLVDRNGEALETRVKALGPTRGEVRTLVGDLTDPSFVREVASFADARTGLLVHSAGISSMGSFLELELEPQLRAVDLHCRTSLTLAHAFGRSMRARGSGGIILLSSNSAFLHSPLIANYAATKAYTLALSEALWEELRHDGVDVLALVPGMTDTALFAASRPHYGRAARFMQKPDAVAEGALRALGKQPTFISSAGDRVAAAIFARALPRKWALALARKSMTYFFPQHGDERPER